MAAETAVITGASSGIGLELARLFAKSGANLVLVARRQELLDALASELRAGHGIQVRVLVADLRQPAAPEVIVRTLADWHLDVDVLVNNAGFGAKGKFAELDPERQSDMITVNVTAPTRLARLLLPGMLQRRRGGILNVGSIAGFQPGPLMTVYYATKAYFQSFSEALAEEVRGSGVTITCLAPGPTRTGFAEAADMPKSRLFWLGAMPALAVAQAGYDGFRRGRALVIPGLLNRLASWSVRLVPRSSACRVAGWLNR